MKYVMLIYQGPTPTVPGSDRWKALPETEQKQIYVDYADVTKSAGVTPGLPLPSEPVAALEPFKESLVQQVSRLLQFFFAGSEYSKVDQVVLAGGCATIDGIAAMLQEHTGVHWVVANPLARLSMSPKVQGQSLSQDAPALMIAVGLALRSFD